MDISQLENKSVAAKNIYIVHNFYYTWHNSCLTHLTNSQLSFLWIPFHRVDLDFTFSALHMFGYGNKFIHIVQVGYTNNQSKILVIFIDVHTRIKGVQVGGPEMKILSFPDDATFFLLRDINYHNRIQSILKSHEKASSSKTYFSRIEFF